MGFVLACSASDRTEWKKYSDRTLERLQDKSAGEAVNNDSDRDKYYMKEFLENFPNIIKEASKSPLGIAALLVLLLAIVGLSFFNGSSDLTKLAFILAFFVFCLEVLHRSFKKHDQREERIKVGNEVHINKSDISTKDSEEKLENKKKFIEARELLDKGKFDEASKLIDQVLNVENSRSAYILKSVLLGRMEKYQDAIDTCTAGLNESNGSTSAMATLYYNRACYKSILKNEINDILNDIREAIYLKPELLENVLNDEDLSYAREYDNFNDFIKKWNVQENH